MTGLLTTADAARTDAAATERTERHARSSAARALLLTTAGLVLLVSLPVILRGAPLADDYTACVDVARRGLADHVAWMFRFTGVVRPARYLEVALIGAACPHRALGVLIAASLLMTIGIAFIVRLLLHDLGVLSPWPELGAAVWLLQPLGAEASLWPSALHLPLGLTLALLAVALYRRGHTVAGVVAGAVACLCAEQIIFALPAAAWLITPPPRRVRALAAAAIASVLVLVAYQRWPGTDPRAPLSIGEMARNAFRAPFFYVRLPAAALGVHSVPLAIAWAFPGSVLVLGLGAAAGFGVGPRLFGTHGNARGPGGPPGSMRRIGAAAVMLTVLLNIPVVVTYPHATSGRVFTPTWLMLSIVGAMAGSRVRWRRLRLAGAVGGFAAASALLCLALSAWVRVRTADIAEASFRWLGARVPQGGMLAICDVQRAMVSYAPIGDFHTSEFLHIWLAEVALRYHAGVDARVRQGGQYWDARCPDVRGADLVVTPAQILDGVRRDSARADAASDAPRR
jgi:hypothetical protein